MPIDGMFVSKLANELKSEIKGGRINSVNQLNKSDFVLEIRVPGRTLFLYISVSYNNPTIFISPAKFEKPEIIPSFMMLLRKHLEGSFISDFYQINNDRIIRIDIEQKDEMEGIKKKSLIIELVGRFANLLLLDENDIIIDAVKQLSVLESENRGIMRGMKYEPLKAEKLDPNDQNEIDQIFNINDNVYPKKIMESIMGISPSLADYLASEYQKSNLDFFTFFQSETTKIKPTSSDKDYYYFDIFNQGQMYFDSLSSLLFDHYQKEAEKKILKENNSTVYKTVSSALKRLNKKIIKLNDELEKDKDSASLRLKGELLLANINNKFDRSSKITLTNYYDNSEIEVDINPLKSIKDNANDYFKKYRKAKNAIDHLNEQIQIAENERDYFNLISYQLESASLKDVLEIKKELEKENYIYLKDNKKHSKKQKPNFLTFNIGKSIIYVGKNNLQNDYLSHTLASPYDLWFHVKDAQGSHVIVKGEDKESEEVIRYAAKLAALYSSLKDSSSIPVDYTHVKNLKKIPGKKGCFVSYTHQKTIYIDTK